jgi:hypothetical protein
MFLKCKLIIQDLKGYMSFIILANETYLTVLVERSEILGSQSGSAEE